MKKRLPIHASLPAVIDVKPDASARGESMVRFTSIFLLAMVGVALFGSQRLPAATVTYDIVYVRAPRDAARPGQFAEVFRPFSMEPNSDLVLLHPDGREEVLVDAPANGAVADPFVSFDAQWVFYSLFPDIVRINDYPKVPLVGADIFKVNIATKQVVQLTHGEYTPNAVGAVSFPVFNTGPAPLAGGRIVFTSNRNGLLPPKEFTPVTMQMFTMNADGSDVEAIAPMTLGSALHPFQLKDGRIAFSTFESQGVRDERLWGQWTIWEDGTNWGPLVSAFKGPDTAFHFASQLSNADVVVEGYYNLNNEGFGWLFKFPATSPAAPINFGSPFVNQAAPGLTMTLPGASATVDVKFPFQPIGATAVTPFTHDVDREAPQVNGAYTGKVTHPSGAPNNDLLLVWSPGPVNSNGNHPPYVDAGIYIARNGFANTPGDLVAIKNAPNFNEQWPRAVVSYKAIYGVDEPHRLPVNQNDGTKHAGLLPGTPYGIVGTASVFQRESAPGVAGSVNFDGLDPFYDCFGQCSNWFWQGSDAGLYSNEEIGAMRIVALEGRSVRGPGTWRVPIANERMRVLGEVPIQADGSFAAKIPADTPFTFQLLDKGGRLLTMAQTWHQVRPGEMRVDCGGCHSHSKAPLNFATSAAATLAPTDLTLVPAHDVEFVKDIRPILQAKCAKCHTATGPAPRLDATANTTTATNPDQVGYPLDYSVLASNAVPSFGGPKTINRIGGLNVSRWVRLGQSRRSVLLWTLAGKRLDGWTNDRWPTETVPGDATSLPAGANRLLADLDYRVDHSALVTDAERRTFAAWIDLFAPIDTGGGFFVDETRPVLTLKPLDGKLIVGAADAYSGLDANSLSVTVNGSGLALSSMGDGRWSGPFTGGAVVARVKDRAGNWTERKQKFGATTGTSSVPQPATNVRITTQK
jgi:hypothetical protein